jgi:hypothetical protein
MDRNARHRVMNSQIAVFDKADELGIRQQLSGYAQMTPDQRRAVSPQVSRLAEALGVNVEFVKKYMVPPYSMFDTLEHRRQDAEAAATKQAPLPVGWAAHSDPASGKTFYAHAATGTSQWGFPVATASAPASAERNPYSYDETKVDYDYIPGYSAFNLKKEREYITRLEEKNTRLEEENARLEKENAALIELLPGRGRGGSRKRTIRRKRRH